MPTQESSDSTSIGSGEGTGDRVFLRKASGLIKTASTTDVFIFNVGLVSIGIGIGGLLLYGPAVYPGGNLIVGVLIAARDDGPDRLGNAVLDGHDPALGRYLPVRQPHPAAVGGVHAERRRVARLAVLLRDRRLLGGDDRHSSRCSRSAPRSPATRASQTSRRSSRTRASPSSSARSCCCWPAESSRRGMRRYFLTQKIVVVDRRARDAAAVRAARCSAPGARSSPTSTSTSGRRPRTPR